MFTVQFVVDSNFTAPSVTSVFVNTNISFSIGLTFSGPLFSVHPMHHLRSRERLPVAAVKDSKSVLCVVDGVVPDCPARCLYLLELYSASIHEGHWSKM